MMSGWRFHILITNIFMPLLTLLYDIEIQAKWGYMGFPALIWNFSFGISILLANLFAFSLGTKINTRNILLLLVHYLFLIPSLILLAALDLESNYFAALITFSIILVFSSTLPFKTFRFPRLSTTKFFFLALILFLSGILTIAAFGGLTNFNLNIFRVYEFRRAFNVDLPTIISYLFSGISKVIAPMLLLLAVYFRSTVFFAASLFLIFVMFGMTHHKSVLFLPVFALMLYLSLQFQAGLRWISLTILLAVLVFVAEALFLYATDRSTPGFINALISRRAFFLPALLNTFYIDFFQENPKVYWATSKFGLGLASNPYDRALPFLIGDVFFGREQMSANVGIIGSGFAHAGLVGVAIYSFLAGCLIAFLNAYGKLIGHPFVAAASASMFLTIISSTDLSTAVLTHGLYMLVIMLMLFPKRQYAEP